MSRGGLDFLRGISGGAADGGSTLTVGQFLGDSAVQMAAGDTNVGFTPIRGY